MAGEDGDDGATIAATLLGSLLNVPDRERESIASTLGRIRLVAKLQSHGYTGTLEPAA